MGQDASNRLATFHSACSRRNSSRSATVNVISTCDGEDTDSTSREQHQAEKQRKASRTDANSRLKFMLIVVRAECILMNE